MTPSPLTRVTCGSNCCVVDEVLDPYDTSVVDVLAVTSVIAQRGQRLLDQIAGVLAVGS
jgi:hypothetical protein